ncbi:EF-P beta-lysylation protein EpmB [Xanthomonas translucens]|uniref:EF-P beta-lysylation protein EpmB n=2 Tax=Xanthomonas campestris pv. translucens TaxID=343 RepID=UPI00071E6F43|nr:EF-P beta-lysylation protein EpmB [Xanthomonas translucens]KWV11067.1 EF-P beta-lysylation protein EpmB [Xanthomonas translucens]MCS3359205.1 EF-P beta-lysylation protein EpmB [Xanthomonas translucens pv. translucens]MCS3373148.1 EF-P beta-lysylation protein EpmB [Xanthomonas translucens pv. translucens]MCT8273266.1 EF-P beta-lysylation protein EpmB [Xanthomonas translucens pv. translucens]MCT8276595.1 EF-P beta-lysylation protein EpmB [Xanthomonas translucens pv. translucens]
MITAAPRPMQPSPSPAVPSPPRWQQLWRDAVRDARELLALLGLDAQALGVSEQAATQFALRVPRGFVARMRHGDAHDPLLRQVLPIGAELRRVPGFALDAVGDAAAKKADGVIQKYRGRALLVATGSCAVHCRYCFRRHFPYAEETAARDGWREAVAAIAADPDIDEVILSGGDPLSLATSKLVELTEALADIPHLKRLRIHSRLPVVLPERVDAPLLAWLRALPWPVAFVIHANHANEFDASVDAALAQLRGSGAHLLNQAVLLRGVNDSVAALAALSERSFAAGVLPYYLHQLDRVEGVAHFEVDDATARALHQALAARLSGYLVPKLVREIAGDTGKRAL